MPRKANYLKVKHSVILYYESRRNKKKKKILKADALSSII